MDFLFWRIKELKIPNCQPEIYPWIIWYIWKARNEKVFNGIEVPPHITLQIACSEATAWEKAKESENPTETDDVANPTIADYDHREDPCLICRTDASWLETDPRMGLGWVYKKINGRYLIGLKSTERNVSALHAEIDGLLWAMESLLDNGISDVKMETDCKVLTHMIEEPPDWPAFYGELDRFETLQKKFHSFTISFIPRNKNFVSDCLAKKARKRKVIFSYVSSSLPNWFPIRINELEET